VSPGRTSDNVGRLIKELCKLPQETEWVEFKVNKAIPERIGEYISALANGAALEGKLHGYLMWGIDNVTHEIVGTNFDPTQTQVGNEELESWLLRLLTPKIQFRFYAEVIEGKRVVLLEITQANRQPVAFRGQEWIRLGTYTKKLKGFPERERELWRTFDRTPFETSIAMSDASTEDIVRLLDYSIYFDLMRSPVPNSHAGVLQVLESEELIRRQDTGAWAITNLGAVLFAKQLSDFSTLRRKTVRVIAYNGNSRVESASEKAVGRGYASGFESLTDLILAFVPVNEAVVSAIRRSVPMYPPLAIRELLANALIHQDFSVSGAGPMIEIFENRMEITNPGASLVDIDRLLDNPPRSRNEMLASVMRRMGVCEERGSGIDKVVFNTEVFQLPAPIFEATGDATRAVLFAPSAAFGDGQERPRSGLLSARFTQVRQPRVSHQHHHPGALRHRDAEQRERLSADQGSGRRRDDRACRRARGQEADEVRALLGGEAVMSAVLV
jgi:ATP-dependent DNA helicase RecG